jgi:hypothetical protein
LPTGDAVAMGIRGPRARLRARPRHVHRDIARQHHPLAGQSTPSR